MEGQLTVGQLITTYNIVSQGNTRYKCKIYNNSQRIMTKEILLAAMYLILSSFIYMKMYSFHFHYFNNLTGYGI